MWRTAGYVAAGAVTVGAAAPLLVPAVAGALGLGSAGAVAGKGHASSHHILLIFPCYPGALATSVHHVATGAMLALCHGAGSGLPTAIGIGGAALGASGAAIAQALAPSTRPRRLGKGALSAPVDGVGRQDTHLSRGERSEGEDSEEEDAGVCIRRRRSTRGN
jgi:hypothetical protein